MVSVTPVNGPGGRVQLHASTVAIDGKAVAIAGPAGAGKSSLAIQLITLGGTLVSDDITWLGLTDGHVIASSPPNISGQIEARGMGILNAPVAPPSPLVLVVDLGTQEADRIPPHRHITLLGQDIPLVHNVKTHHFAATVYHYMTYGRVD